MVALVGVLLLGILKGVLLAAIVSPGASERSQMTTGGPGGLLESVPTQRGEHARH
jgi:hypothetical protein